MTIAVLGSALRGGGVQVLDVLLETVNPEDISVYDDDKDTHDKTVLGVRVIGCIDKALEHYKSGVIETCVIAIGSTIPRKSVYEKVMHEKIPLSNVISNRAIISKYTRIGQGNIVLPGVYIGPNTKIGDNNYFTTGTQINHDTKVGSHCYFSAGAVVAGRVTIGDSCRFDTSCCITADAIVENSTLIKANSTHGPIRGI